MSVQQLFVAAAREHLCAGKKSLSIPQSLELAAQVSAVSLGLKPALLYDSNAACLRQVQQYLSSLRSLKLVSESLLLLDLNGNSLIVNANMIKSHLCDDTLAVIDVRPTLEYPSLTDTQGRQLKNVMTNILERFQQQKTADEPVCVGEECDKWNLCTVFGLLLGYPVTYWFDQTESFENCLSMTPLMLVTASATWHTADTSHRCCLYSFSIPVALQAATHSRLENWKLGLRQRFEQQHILKDLSFCQSIVTLKSVCL